MKTKWINIVIFLLAAMTSAVSLAGSRKILPQQFDIIDWTNSIPETDRNTFPAAFASQEYVRGRAFQVSSIAYVRNTTITYFLQMYNPVNLSDTASLKISNVRYVCDNGTIYSLLVDGVTSKTWSGIAVGALSSWYPTTSMSFTGLPDCVTKGYFTYDLLVQSVNGYLQLLSHPYMRCFLTDYTPTSTQSLPWTEVLEYACGWADTHKDVYDPMADVTKNVNHTSRLTFPATDFSDYWVDAADNKFRLKDYLNATTTTYGNSRDVASFVRIAANALGETPLIRYYESNIGTSITREGFVTNTVTPIGSGTNRRVYLGRQYYNTLPDPTGTQVWAYDATFKHLVDLSGGTYNEVPYAWQQGSYWQTKIGTSYYGLVSRFGYPYGTTLYDIRSTTVNFVEPSFANETVAHNAAVTATLAGVK